MQTGRQDLVKSAEFRALLADLCAWGILVSDGAKYRFGPFSFRLATAVA
jgi:DNA-binding IclR family transcriptional regulator